MKRIVLAILLATMGVLSCRAGAGCGGNRNGGGCSCGY